MIVNKRGCMGIIIVILALHHSYCYCRPKCCKECKSSVIHLDSSLWRYVTIGSRYTSMFRYTHC